MSTPSKQTRRSFQFSLATLFLGVTAFATWLAWELKLVRDRKAAIARLRPGIITSARQKTFPPPISNRAPSIPFWRRWLGDEAISAIALHPKTSQAEIVLMQHLFPEALTVGLEDEKEAVLWDDNSINAFDDQSTK